MRIRGPQNSVGPVRRPGAAPLFQQGLRILPHHLVNLLHHRGGRFRGKRCQLFLGDFNVGVFAGLGGAGRCQGARMVAAEPELSLLIHGLKKPFAENFKHCLRTRFARNTACHNFRPGASGTASRSPSATEGYDRSD